MLPDMMPIVIDLPRRDVCILPCSDIHIGSKQFSQSRWEKFKEQAKGKYIMIVGDCIDNGIKSSISSTYEQTMMPSAQKEWLYQELKPFAEDLDEYGNSRILCGVGGNHEKRTKRETDQDPLYDVFCRLRIEEKYRQSTAFCFLRINGKDRVKQGKYRPTYSVMVTHGSGGGQLIGAGLNKLQRYGGVVEGLDMMISGHTHRPADFVSGRLYCDHRNKRILEREFVSITASSFLDYGGYPLDKLLLPTGHSFQEIVLSPTGKNIKVIQSMGGE